MFTVAMAYCGSGDNRAIRRLLHVAVSITVHCCVHVWGVCVCVCVWCVCVCVVRCNNQNTTTFGNRVLHCYKMRIMMCEGWGIFMVVSLNFVILLLNGSICLVTKMAQILVHAGITHDVAIHPEAVPLLYYPSNRKTLCK